MLRIWVKALRWVMVQVDRSRSFGEVEEVGFKGD
jgi:hypothetical protein